MLRIKANVKKYLRKVYIYSAAGYKKRWVETKEDMSLWSIIYAGETIAGRMLGESVQKYENEARLADNNSCL